MFLANAPSYADPVVRLSKRAVARAAGFARGTLDNHFPTVDAWRDGVANYLLNRTDMFREEFAEIERTIASSADSDVVDATLRVAETDLRTLANNPAWNAMEVLATCVAPRSEAVAATARHCYGELDLATWADIYGPAMRRGDRVPREPFDERTIGALLQALVEGCGIRHLFEEGTFLDPAQLGESERYGTYAAAVAALLAVLTRGASGRDRRTVHEVVQELIL